MDPLDLMWDITKILLQGKFYVFIKIDFFLFYITSTMVCDLVYQCGNLRNRADTYMAMWFKNLMSWYNDGKKF